MRPLVDAGLVAPDADVTATSITGYSGGGKKMIEQYQGWHARQMDGERQIDAALSAPRPYALGLAHKHIPEMKTCSRLTRAPVFMPIVGNFYKGLTVSIPFHLRPARRRHRRRRRCTPRWPRATPTSSSSA